MVMMLWMNQPCGDGVEHLRRGGRTSIMMNELDAQPHVTRFLLVLLCVPFEFLFCYVPLPSPVGWLGFLLILRMAFFCYSWNSHLALSSFDLINMMSDPDDVALHFSDDLADKRPLKHTTAVFFHLAFRSTAVVVYLLCGWFTNSFMSCFVTILLLLSLDFWTVKNITGRLLVGLRWWNYIDDDGNSHWVFESRKGEESQLVNASESQVFWMALVLFPAVWFLLLFVSFFKLNVKWFIVVIIAITLNGANLYGYLRCKIGGNENFTGVISNFFGRQVISNALSSLWKKKPEQPPPNLGFTNTV